jgi:hypothetical protein
MSYLPIRYWGFHDIPRAFLVEWKGTLFFFDSPFIDQRDEFDDCYTIYAFLPNQRSGFVGPEWPKMLAKGTLLGRTSIQSVEFDVTRRHSMSERSLKKILHDIDRATG